VSGQKVWTSGADSCNRGFATVRTDPDAAKHAGISMMVIDMHAKGVDIRPLRQITGHSHFSEVFFDELFVPDGDVVGPVDQGWVVARSTLGNERVSIGGGRGAGGGSGMFRLMKKRAQGDPEVARQVGALFSEQHSMALLNLRRAARAVAGTEPGAEGNVTKLLGSEIGQRIATLSARMLGSEAAVTDGEDGQVPITLLALRSASIAGGTSEIVRNQIAERLLGLPRDPLIR
jgi:alkylation response protein AidB-like acyl-CoA dehydrogenase